MAVLRWGGALSALWGRRRRDHPANHQRGQQPPPVPRTGRGHHASHAGRAHPAGLAGLVHPAYLVDLACPAYREGLACPACRVDLAYPVDPDRADPAHPSRVDPVNPGVLVGRDPEDRVDRVDPNPGSPAPGSALVALEPAPGSLEGPFAPSWAVDLAVRCRTSPPRSQRWDRARWLARPCWMLSMAAGHSHSPAPSSAARIAAGSAAVQRPDSADSAPGAPRHRSAPRCWALARASGVLDRGQRLPMGRHLHLGSCACDRSDHPPEKRQDLCLGTPQIHGLGHRACGQEPGRKHHHSLDQDIRRHSHHTGRRPATVGSEFGDLDSNPSHPAVRGGPFCRPVARDRRSPHTRARGLPDMAEGLCPFRHRGPQAAGRDPASRPDPCRGVREALPLMVTRACPSLAALHTRGHTRAPGPPG
mmetsp:Transcript_17446/g.41407  ORF Transcript_17446/g.41407 Transcript_17446/m.41407 type:complete len:419 (+) Transcript_17446:643-1899(+)